jgi:hypothetical protein
MSQLLGPQNVHVTLHVDQKGGIHLATVTNISAASNIKHSSCFQITEHLFCSENTEVSFHSVISYRTTRLENSRHTSMNSHKRTPVLFPQRFQVTVKLEVNSLRDYSRRDLSLTSRILTVTQASKCGQEKKSHIQQRWSRTINNTVWVDTIGFWRWCGIWGSRGTWLWRLLTTFWDVPLCSLTENCWRFEGTCCLYFLGRRVRKWANNEQQEESLSSLILLQK